MIDLRIELAPTRLAELIASGYEATAWCVNARCGRARIDGTDANGIPVDLRAFDPQMTHDRLEARLTCTLCGERQVKLALRAPAKDRHVPGVGHTPTSSGPLPPQQSRIGPDVPWVGKRGRARRRR